MTEESAATPRARSIVWNDAGSDVKVSEELKTRRGQFQVTWTGASALVRGRYTHGGVDEVLDITWISPTFPLPSEDGGGDGGDDSWATYSWHDWFNAAVDIAIAVRDFLAGTGGGKKPAEPGGGGDGGEAGTTIYFKDNHGPITIKCD